MKAVHFVLAALCSLAAAVPQAEDIASRKGPTLTYTVTSTKTENKTVTGKSTVFITTTLTRPYGFPA